MKSLILEKWDLKQRIKRLAFQIVEDQFDEDELCLVGIYHGGLKTASLLMEEIIKIKDFNISVNSLSINKEQPLSEAIVLSESIDFFKNKTIILVDDVANSGRTIFYALQPFTQIATKSVKVAVLVDRTHKKFPIACNFVGTSLATTIREHIEVVFDGDDVEAAYLV